MIEFFDTSVLIAAMVEDERRHEACARVLEETSDGHASMHSLAECYATLTSGRLGVRLSPTEAVRLVRHNVHGRLSLLGLTSHEYLKLLDAAGPAGARGGAIYDFLLLACARKIKAEKIYTLNPRHFIAFAPDLEKKFVQP
jgi:predicted nucleic acid-binding protein